MTTETTTVVIVGAGSAGLTLGNLLLQQGIDCIILERHSRSHVETRQRAGVLEHRNGKMFQRSGLAEVVADARTDVGMEFRINGQVRTFSDADRTGGRSAFIVTQQQLVTRLIEMFLVGGGDLRFEIDDIAVHDLAGARPRVTYRGQDTTVGEISCQYLAGCDGFHGVSRRSIPKGVLSEFSYDHGVGWLTVLAQVPPPRAPLFVVSHSGFAAAFARGPAASRYYLQCQPGDTVSDWPAERVWAQLRHRLADDDLPIGTITDQSRYDLTSFVCEPMSYGKLYLAGDAAHVLSPMGGKGMNLAIYDAEMLAAAIGAALEGDEKLLDSYSDTCLRRAWDYQEFSHWFTVTVHEAGDPAAGPFRQRLAQARLERLFTNPAAATLFAELQVGVS